MSGGTTTSGEVTGLTNGTDYEGTVQALHSNGNGRYADWRPFTPKASTPTSVVRSVELYRVRRRECDAHGEHFAGVDDREQRERDHAKVVGRRPQVTTTRRRV